MKYLMILSVFVLASCSTVNPNGWKSTDVTYSFVSAPYHIKSAQISQLGTNIVGISVGDARELVRRAAIEWSKHSDLNLIEVNDSPSVTIRIGEADLSGSIAGFGYFPSNNPVSGDMHFDSSNRKWNKKMFYKVALHEIGHTIGLAHSMHKRSIMYYKVTNVDKLSSFDIERLKKLYNR